MFLKEIRYRTVPERSRLSVPFGYLFVELKEQRPRYQPYTSVLLEIAAGDHFLPRSVVFFKTCHESFGSHISIETKSLYHICLEMIVRFCKNEIWWLFLICGQDADFFLTVKNESHFGWWYAIWCRFGRQSERWRSFAIQKRGPN